MSNDGYEVIRPEFDQGLNSLSVARALKDRNDIEGAKNKSKEAIRLFNHCDNHEAKQKANEAQQLLNSLG